MAIFHLTAKIVSRSKGQSAVAKAAYNAHDHLTNDKTGERHDYRHKGEVRFSGIFAPKNAPDWVRERERLWSEVEKAENRKNSQLAREVEVALPNELTEEQRERLVKDFVRENFVRHGMVADVAIHAPSKEGDTRNHHAHILLTMREIGPEGFGAKMRDFNSKAQLDKWRENWERTANRYLEKHGHEARIDRRSLEAQGIDREPTIHKGPITTQFEREGVLTDRGGINRDIETRNRQREELKKELEDNERLHKALLRPVSKNAAQIRDAFQQTEGGGDLAAALKERGFALAAVSAADAQESQRQKDRYLEASKEIKTAKRPPSVLKKGDIVLVNEYGDMHRLNEYTTALPRSALEERLKGGVSRNPRKFRHGRGNPNIHAMRGHDPSSRCTKPIPFRERTPKPPPSPLIAVSD